MPKSFTPEEVGEGVSRKLDAQQPVREIVVQTHYGSIALPVTEFWEADGRLTLAVDASPLEGKL